MGKDIELLERTFIASIEIERERIKKSLTVARNVIDEVSNIGFISEGVIETFKENSKIYIVENTRSNAINKLEYEIKKLKMKIENLRDEIEKYMHLTQLSKEDIENYYELYKELIATQIELKKLYNTEFPLYIIVDEVVVHG